MDLPLAGRAVELVTFSPFGLWLTLPDAGAPGTSPESDFVLRIDGSFRLTTPTAEVDVDPGEGPNTVYLALLRRVVEEATARADGTLVIRFVDGDRLRVGTDAHESWMLSGNGRMLIGGPAGASPQWIPQSG